MDGPFTCLRRHGTSLLRKIVGERLIVTMTSCRLITSICTRPSNSGRKTLFHRYDLTSSGGWALPSFSYLTLYPRLGCKFPTLMLEVLRWSICHPTLYRRTDTMLPMLTFLANSWRRWLPMTETSETSPTDCQDCMCACPPFQSGAFLDH